MSHGFSDKRWKNLLACAALAIAGVNVSPTAHAIDITEASYALAPTWVPSGPANGSVSATAAASRDGWHIEAKFTWKAVNGRPAWHLVESNAESVGQVATLSDGSPAASASGDGAPSVPDPNPPTGAPNGGGTVTNTFWDGGWSYTVTYEWGTRNGVLGWHITSVSMTYAPKNPYPPTSEK